MPFVKRLGIRFMALRSIFKKVCPSCREFLTGKGDVDEQIKLLQIRPDGIQFAQVFSIEWGLFF